MLASRAGWALGPDAEQRRRPSRNRRGAGPDPANLASDTAEGEFPQCPRQRAGSVAAMDPDLLLDHLDRAERHIASYRKKITEQIEFIAWLNWLHKDATGAIALLREFEMRLAAHTTDRERLRAQLAHLGPTATTMRTTGAPRLTETRILQLHAAVGNPATSSAS